MDDNIISVFDFLTQNETITKLKEQKSGHGGGDEVIVRDFLLEASNYSRSKNESRSSAAVSLERVLICFTRSP